jgi:hypothetical protein
MGGQAEETVASLNNEDMHLSVHNMRTTTATQEKRVVRVGDDSSSLRSIKYRDIRFKTRAGR